MKPTPAWRTHAATPSGPRSIATPSACARVCRVARVQDARAAAATVWLGCPLPPRCHCAAPLYPNRRPDRRTSSTSALPHRLDTERLPCLATLAPAAAATMLAPVLMLTEPMPSPPVPTMSTTARAAAAVWLARRQDGCDSGGARPLWLAVCSHTRTWRANLDADGLVEHGLRQPGNLVGRLALRAQARGGKACSTSEALRTQDVGSSGPRKKALTLARSSTRKAAACSDTKLSSSPCGWRVAAHPPLRTDSSTESTRY